MCVPTLSQTVPPAVGSRPVRLGRAFPRSLRLDLLPSKAVVLREVHLRLPGRGGAGAQQRCSMLPIVSRISWAVTSRSWRVPRDPGGGGSGPVRPLDFGCFASRFTHGASRVRMVLLRSSRSAAVQAWDTISPRDPGPGIFLRCVLTCRGRAAIIDPPSPACGRPMRIARRCSRRPIVRVKTPCTRVRNLPFLRQPKTP